MGAQADRNDDGRWGYVLDASVVEPGRAVTVQVRQHWLAICNDQGIYYACDNACPHAGGSLGRGEVRNGCISCPVHHWPWDLRTGLTDPAMPWLHLKRFPCEVREGKVYVDLKDLPS